MRATDASGRQNPGEYCLPEVDRWPEESEFRRVARSGLLRGAAVRTR